MSFDLDQIMTYVTDLLLALLVLIFCGPFTAAVLIAVFE